jgi:flotillin
MSGVFIGVAVALVVVGFFAFLAVLSLAGNLLYICEPNEVLIFSGRRRKVSGKEVGYRYVRGGRAWRTPLVEKVDRLDLTNMIIEVQVTGAYSFGGIPLNVQGVANIKIAGHEPILDKAVERLMGKHRNEVMLIAKDVLEGNLRGVLAKLTPEEVNDDKLAFAENLRDEAEEDLAALGLILDNMKIQNVHDDRGYLDSIGRKKSAELIKRARVAEADASALAKVQAASNRRRARLQEIEAEKAIAEAESIRRVTNAKTKGQALIAEAKGTVNAEIARTEAAITAAEATVEQTRLRLQADIIEPSKANMEAGISEAKGRASKILEDGRATNTVLREMIAVWGRAGTNARDIFLMQKMDAVMNTLVSTIGTVKVDRLTMLPEGGAGDSSAMKAVRLVEELKSAIGVDIPMMLERVTQGDSRASQADDVVLPTRS